MTASPVRRRRVVGLIVTAVAAVGAAGVSGYVVDGMGSPAIGFWSIVWGVGVGLFGLTVVAVVTGAGLARVLLGLVAVGAGVVGGMLLLFTGPFELAPTSPEGLWMYPSITACAVVAVLSARRAVTGG